eukprot:scaffold50138_cov61-Phaeocystis_antarctica.AAC.3
MRHQCYSEYTRVHINSTRPGRARSPPTLPLHRHRSPLTVHRPPFTFHTAHSHLSPEQHQTLDAFGKANIAPVPMFPSTDAVALQRGCGNRCMC